MTFRRVRSVTSHKLKRRNREKEQNMTETNGGEKMKKATRFSFTNNKDTALTAPEKLVLARPDETDSDADP